MSKQQSIRTLIERSSLGSSDARAARARVSVRTGRAIARAATTGRYTSARAATTGRYTSAATAARDPRSTSGGALREVGGNSRQGSNGHGHLHGAVGGSNPDQPE